jgi:hypothetical protein
MLVLYLSHLRNVCAYCHIPDVLHGLELSAWAVDLAEGHTEPEPVDMALSLGMQRHHYSLLNSDEQQQYPAVGVEAWGLAQEGKG